MHKKIIVICLCLLFIFSMLPTTQGSIILVNKNKSLTKSDEVPSTSDYIMIEIAYGIIKYNGEELMDDPWGLCYNITPIFVKALGIGLGENFDISIESFKIEDDPAYISINMTKGFINNHFMFLYRIIKT